MIAIFRPPGLPRLPAGHVVHGHLERVHRATVLDGCPLLDCDSYSLAMILNATKADGGVYAQESLARGRKKASARSAGKCVWQ